ncbi:MAG: hypothetical protein AAB621_02230 [Patescibacteria group bacterium]
MNKLKSTVAVLILILALSGAYLIIYKKEKAFTPPTIIEENNPVAMVRSQPAAPQTADSGATVNLTDIITAKIGADIASKNADGGLITSGGNQFIAASKPEQMATDLISEAQKNFNPETLRPAIKESDLKITSDNTKEGFTSYFNSLNQLVATAAKKIPAGFINPEKISINDFKTTALVYGDFVQNLYSLSAPSELSAIHKKQLELAVFKKNILERVANAEQDPLTAIISIDSLLKIDPEFVKLKEDMTAWIKNHEL